MTILLLGRGGREHALAVAIAEAAPQERLIAAPGNPGMAAVAEIQSLDIDSPDAVVAAARACAADLVVVGPEAPLAAGVADALSAAGVLCFGPSRAAAQLETSKSFAKDVMAAAGAPTAASAIFTDIAGAEAHIRQAGAPIVVKADGLAAGKGVVVAQSVDEAVAAATAMFSGRFGAAGASVLVEEALTGDELSVFAITDGETARIIGSAQDHKRAWDGDLGPNTGGMGAYAPAPLATPALEARVLAEIIEPVLAEMRRRGAPFRGVLYAGLMIDDAASGGDPAQARLNVIEFNVRLGDPEAQVVLPRLRADLPALMRAAAAGDGALARLPIEIADEAALCVVMAAPGYPGEHRSGEAIGGLDGVAAQAGVQVFHAGTARRDGGLVSAGGRVLGVTGRAPTLAEAQARAYAAVAAVDWPGAQYRKDIGWRALAR